MQPLKLEEQADVRDDISKFAAHVQKVAGQSVALRKRTDDHDEV